MVAIMAIYKDLANHWYVSVQGSRDWRPGSSLRGPRQTKGFPTEIEAKQFAKELSSEGMKLTAGTLAPHEPKRRTVTASQIDQWIAEAE
jgi:hypothetical protein